MMDFKTKPYAHQLAAFERFKDSPYFGLFMDMGTGKTKVTIDIGAHKFASGQISAMLVIAPNNVHTQWITEQFPLHCSVPYTAFIWDSSKLSRSYYQRELTAFITSTKPGLKVFAVNVEAFQADTVVQYIANFVKLHTTFIVIDEATRIKHNTAKRTKTIHKLEKYGQRCILTGTPTAKSPFDLWSQMEFLKANYFECNYFIFQHRYGIMMRGVNPLTGGRFLTIIDEKTYSIVSSAIKRMHESRNGKLMPNDYETLSVLHGLSEKNIRFIETQPEYVKYKRLDELRDFIAKDVYSVKKADCLDLPPKVYEKIFVTMSPEQTKIYKNLKAELFAEYSDKTLTVTNKVALTLRLMQVTGGFFPYLREEEHITPTVNGPEYYTKMVGDGELISGVNAKLEALRADIDEVDDDTRIIIWATFVSELKYIYAQLKNDYSCCLYYGNTPDAERKLIIDDFKAGKYKIFIGNTATAGFGLNLQNATLQYYFSNNFKVEDRLQAEDRSHRIGVKSTVVYKDIIAKGTIDEKVYASIKTGRDLNDYFKSMSLADLLDDADHEHQED